MHVTVTCAACQKTFRVDAKYAGRRGKCPSPECGAVYLVPEPEYELVEEPVRNRAARKNAASKSGRGSKASNSGRKKPGWLSQLHKASFLVGVGITALMALVVIMFLPGRTSTVAAETRPKDGGFDRTVVPFMKQHCMKCHSGGTPEGGVSFDALLHENSLQRNRKNWERALELISSGIMPPKEAPQPKANEKSAVEEYLNTALYSLDCAQTGDPGRVTMRRLNRAEYNNTVRDLLGVTFRPADEFPSDDVGEGFDNIGEVLSLPPLLMEKYLQAAEKIASHVIYAQDTATPQVTPLPFSKFKMSPVAHPHGDSGAIVLVSNGGMGVHHQIPINASYIVRVEAAETPAGNEKSKMALKINGKVVKTFDVGAPIDQPKVFEHKQAMNAGDVHCEIEFLNDFYDPKAKNPNRRDRNLVVFEVSLAGPVDIPAESYPETHRRLVVHQPGKAGPDEAFRNNLAPLLKRAFRRPVQPEEVERYVRLGKLALTRGESFEAGMQVAITGILVSPSFLFRAELDSSSQSSSNRALNDYELANRLSYFLWSSMPDEELLRLADEGKLRDETVLLQQTRRMLSDPKSEALVENFGDQWLQLRILDEIKPDPKLFPQYDAALAHDMREETRKVFSHIMREDRSVLEFIDGDYTFVNERLANFYGFPSVQGTDFRRVGLSGQRSGILTHASIMTLTSNPTRTSPVKRGKWIMEVVLDTPPPPPPPNVPDLETTAATKPDTSLRQQLEIHRQNAICNSCHHQMDQLGFGLENLDAIGRWRDQDGKFPVDSSGVLPKGEKFRGPKELAAVLKQKSCQFAGSLAGKLLTYALGRGLDYTDKCTTDKIVKVMQEKDFRFSVLVTEIVKSDPFRFRAPDRADQ